MTSPSATLGTLLRSLVEQLDRDVEAAYLSEGLDFRPRFTPVVRALDEAGPLRIKDIAEAAGLTHSATSQTVSELVAKGWLVLTPGTDARSRVVSFSASGLQRLPRVKAIWRTVALAAQSMNNDLPVALEDIARAALSALDRNPFAARISAMRALTSADVAER